MRTKPTQDTYRDYHFSNIRQKGYTYITERWHTEDHCALKSSAALQLNRNTICNNWNISAITKEPIVKEYNQEMLL